MATKSRELQLIELENELREMKDFHSSAWDTYGSELCAGDMIRQEKNLEEKIIKLKNEFNDQGRNI